MLILFSFVTLILSGVSSAVDNCRHVSFVTGGRAILTEERMRVTFDTEEVDCLVHLGVLLVGGGGDGAAFGGNGGGSGYIVYEEVSAQGDRLTHVLAQ